MNALICPLCAAALSVTTSGLVCPSRHSFDRAREGYFNLLPVQFKHSREPGDAKQQLQSRQLFLQSGFYQPLADQLLAHVPPETNTLLDIGCGEGYFSRHFGNANVNTQIYGIDIAKEAVRLAAKSANPRDVYAVASSYALPIANQSIDVVTRIYAPSKDEELARVIKPNGRVIIVTPAENHLITLRQKIYKTIRPHAQPKVPEGFVEVASDNIAFDLHIPAGEHCSALLQMTPFAWSMPASLMEELRETGLKDQADFRITVYQLHS